ncbi:MAG: dienelactone hydrolase [Verrucomicrobiales bacterium]|jgi:dienelactone hydrolase
MNSRRTFLKSAAAGAAGASLASAEAAQPETSPEIMTPDALREQLVTCLGGPWPEPCPLEPEIRETTQKDGYRLESLTYEVEPGDRVPALLLVPDGVDAQNPAPAVAIWHQHNGQYQFGKNEPAGLAGSEMHHTGVALAKEGYVVLCPDALCFEERQDPAGKLKGGNFERFEFLRYVVNGTCMAWKNILDMRRAVDFLCERPEIDAENLGCYGHSMGSTHAWLVGPHEQRLKAVVGNCCLPTYSAIHDHRLLHCFPNFVPGWLEYGDTPEMAGLIAPRALHLNLGDQDGGSPIEHAKEGIKRIESAYAEAKAEENFTWFIEEDTGHVLSEEMWKRTSDFFAKHLRS